MTSPRTRVVPSMTVDAAASRIVVIQRIASTPCCKRNESSPSQSKSTLDEKSPSTRLLPWQRAIATADSATRSRSATIVHPASVSDRVICSMLASPSESEVRSSRTMKDPVPTGDGAVHSSAAVVPRWSRIS